MAGAGSDAALGVSEIEESWAEVPLITVVIRDLSGIDHIDPEIGC
jgi:hypothetical protein